MKYIWILIFAVSPCAFAQDAANTVFFQKAVSVGAVGTVGPLGEATRAPVSGAPYSATITNESIQRLADGNRIVQTNTGMIARDSHGRTRQDTVLPAIGNLSAANAPHLIFIQDTVGQISYTLNLADKTAQKIPMMAGGNMAFSAGGVAGPQFNVLTGTAPVAGPPPLPPGPMPGLIPGPGIAFQAVFNGNDQSQVHTENLGSQTMEGVLVNGARTTRTIPAGQIGNDGPIDIVTEVWTSVELKTIVYSKRSDPRMGDQTFRLTNLVRTEPDASLFTVPADFKVIDGPQPIIYRTTESNGVLK